ncbi:MAG: redox-regulated ATPase YchF [Deltaproteobacteria bacterium]|jgi:ribosome-binding ATPase|nr:redox-regulated ATPase YchF [Deltaproteobacteria bacterium]
MEIAIIGLPQSGKSLLFQIMTGINSQEIYGEDVVRGNAKVPDGRFDHLVDIFKPAKVTPATVPFIDINASGEKGWDSTRQSASGADGMLHVVNCYDTEDIPEVVGRYKTLEAELIISDLMIVEKRLEKLLKLPANALKREESIQVALFPKIKDHLESGEPLRRYSLSKDEDDAIRSFSFWSSRPQLIVLNIAEGADNPSEKFQKAAGIEESVMSICCQVELEIADLSQDDQLQFLESMGIEKPAFERIIRTAFRNLQRMYYFTVGEDEVRAWVIKSGSTAPKAAAAIHKDFERGFIRAEVVSYDDFVACGDTLANAKADGKTRLEGKEYIVKDGDIISFRFNV